ncbi:chemotaxis protein CheW [Cupriavidus taiwanensis]|uniref:chemotaxis protein CheW n=1 Tax=Cupriavidus taiwanensis TaxID=164546 RepID=UPI000E2E728B|nr:chemotaxis protein CheW [Cupriavidus taiwanensis]
MKLFLLFRLGADHYALDAAEVAEVLPLTRLKQIPGAPAWVAGLMQRRGQPVPVIDLPALATGVPAAPRTSTRTVLVHYRRAESEPARLLGLRLEAATQTLRCPAESFVDAGVAGASPRYLGPVRHDARGLVQWVRVGALLPDEVHAMLFADAAGETAAEAAT